MLVLDYSERTPHELYSKASKRLGGNWDGEVMDFDCKYGSINIISYEYLSGLFINTASFLLNETFVANNLPYYDENFITIRIGYHGKWSGKNKGTASTEGIILYNSAQSFSVSYPPNELLEWFVIRFPYSVIEQLVKGPSVFDNLINNAAPWFFYYKMTPEIDALVRDVFKIRNNKKLRRTIFLSKAIEIVGRLGIKIEKTINQPAKSLLPNEIEQMLELKNELLRNYSIQPNIEQLSKHYNMSASKLQASFKTVFNIPILRFFNQQRLEAAHRQIKYSSKSITEISYNLGYSHPSHFNKAFKKYFGFTPGSLQ